jgi:adenine specific DNA methylase Mod
VRKKIKNSPRRKVAEKPRQGNVVPAAVPVPVPRAGQDVKVSKAKGRPMLVWVGKRPLERVTAFPTQLIETFNPTGQKAASENLLFHGDNKDVLAWLLANGYRGKVNLIYIDPPFDSGADYVRKVELRGTAGTTKIDGEAYTLGEQIQYTDIWANDNYLQFLYERLLLLRELLSEDGSIYVHINDFRVAPARCIMDEVFGPEHFRNIIVWYFTNKIPDSRKKLFTNSTEYLLFYSKGDDSVFHTLETSREKPIKVSKMEKVEGKKIYTKDEDGKGIYIERTTRIMDNVWNIALLHAQPERENFPTQKPEELISRVLRASSGPGDLVLDCFIGCGTTGAVAQKLARRWIGCDINKGAIQTTSKRLQTIIQEQIETHKEGSRQGKLVEAGAKDKRPDPASMAFSVYRVNDYDLEIQHNEAVNLA